MLTNRLLLLIGTTALIPFVASAQTTPAQPAASSADCDRLIVVLEGYKLPNAPLTLDQARIYKRDANVRACRDALVRAEAATAGASGQSSAAQITVQQATPQVTVQQARPNVTVSQPQPEITVHQPAPTVTVQIPQPEITIRMPKPEVNVAMAQPQVQVTQAKPEVQVLQSAQPQVSIQQTGQQSNGSIQDSEQRPKINYTSEQAKVVVNQPEGAPNVRVEQAGQVAASGAQANAVPVQGASSTQAGMQSFTALRMIRMNVVNARGDVLGDVEHVLTHKAQAKPYVVIGHGGFLGMGEKQVALPVDSMIVRDGKLIMRGMTDDQIRAMPAWTKGSRDYSDMAADQTIQIGTSG